MWKGKGEKGRVREEGRRVGRGVEGRKAEREKKVLEDHQQSCGNLTVEGQ
jgi:hypothetical protein